MYYEEQNKNQNETKQNEEKTLGKNQLRFHQTNIISNITRRKSNITRCKVRSRVKAWLHDSAGDIVMILFCRVEIKI